jgi:putative transposase
MIVQPKNMDSLSKMFKLVAGRYTRYINKTYKRTGTLWEGRFKSSPIEKERYLLACTRYIEMNPVRAKIVKDPKEYRWSSYSNKAFGNKNNPILDFDPYYLELGETVKERAFAYREWFKRSIPEEELTCIRETITRSIPIGSKDFINKLSEKLGRAIKIRARGRPRKEK